MDKDQILERLKATGLNIIEETRLANDTGWCLRLDTGAMVNCYDTGKFVIQGKNQDPVRAALNVAGASKRPLPVKTLAPASSRKVLVVYGHDGPARNSVEAMLRRWDLDPLILDQIPSGGQTIIEKLGSGLIDYSQKMTMAAMQIADMNV
jgi:predicted nucleotide-binding protein